MIRSKVLITLLWHLSLFGSMLFAACHVSATLYLVEQGLGQAEVLWNRQSVTEFTAQHDLSAREKENLGLIRHLKAFSVDSLGYAPTADFEQVYDQQNEALIWLVTASEPFQIRPYTWTFPLIGEVSYKGYFSRWEALREQSRLRSLGYDTELSPVSAWSTLGWFRDPILSENLKLKKGQFCNLMLHELFHATYYASDAVNQNENLAMFVADKATRMYLKSDSAALSDYLHTSHTQRIINAYLQRQMEDLNSNYRKHRGHSNLQSLKNKWIAMICDSLELLPVSDTVRLHRLRHKLKVSGNACFIGFSQYNSLQDSLDKVFNKIYKDNLIAKIVFIKK